MTSEPAVEKGAAPGRRKRPAGGSGAEPRSRAPGGGGGEGRRRALRIAWRIGRWALLVAFLGATVGSGTVAALFAVYGADADLPDVNRLKTYRSKQVTRVLAADGKTLLGEIYDERRTMVPFHRMPKVLVDAVVSAEDARFFQHKGLNLLGMVRAFFANLRAGRYVQGGSTITQQVVKTFFLTSKRTLRRKVQEVILARRLEQTLSKEQILELYLNQIYFGHGRYGVQEASRFYFGKDVEKIGVAEAALLAGLPQGPERLSPIRHPERARKRLQYVLRQMVKQQKISVEVAARLSRGPLPISVRQAPEQSPAPEFLTLVRERLKARFGAAALPYLGLTVVTSCDLRLQRLAREALETGLRGVDSRQGVMRFGPRMGRRSLARARARLTKTQPKNPAAGRIYEGIVTAYDDQARRATIDLGGSTGVIDLRDEPRYNPRKLPPSRLLKRRTLVRVTPTGRQVKGPLDLRLAQGPQGAVVILDVETREVRAMVGGYGFRTGDFNRAIRAIRQPGSTFKPIVYGAALEDRRITATTRLPDAPHPCENWLRIRQQGEKKYAGHLLVRTALAKSVNSIACRVFQRVGSQRVRQLARRLGIHSALTEHLSLALGASGVGPVEMAAAFAVFAGGGRYQAPRYIRRMGSLPVERSAPTQVMSVEGAYVLTSLLTSVIRGGTAWRVRRLRHPAAGKTGTSNRNRDAWFIGYTPSLVAAVWVGHDDFRPLGRGETGGRTAAPIWASLFRKALEGRPKRSFPRPKTVLVRRVDVALGHALPAGGAGGREEYFLPGTAPDAAPTPEVDPGEHVIQDDGT
ncbi:MAG: PBP1A family penicillin-binding protein [bacterium]